MVKNLLVSLGYLFFVFRRSICSGPLLLVSKLPNGRVIKSSDDGNILIYDLNSDGKYWKPSSLPKSKSTRIVCDSNFSQFSFRQIL